MCSPINAIFSQFYYNFFIVSRKKQRANSCGTEQLPSRHSPNHEDDHQRTISPGTGELLRHQSSSHRDDQEHQAPIRKPVIRVSDSEEDSLPSDGRFLISVV